MSLPFLAHACGSSRVPALLAARNGPIKLLLLKLKRRRSVVSGLIPLHIRSHMPLTWLPNRPRWMHSPNVSRLHEKTTPLLAGASPVGPVLLSLCRHEPPPAE